MRPSYIFLYVLYIEVYDIDLRWPYEEAFKPTPKSS